MAVDHAIILLRREETPQCWFHTQHREAVARDYLDFHPLGFVVDANGGADQPPAEQIGEGRGSLLEVLINGIGTHPVADIATVVGPHW